jgi:hypothetical protein
MGGWPTIKERQTMEECCAYCGEEILGEAVVRSGMVYCCQECLNAVNEDQFEFLDAIEYEL